MLNFNLTKVLFLFINVAACAHVVDFHLGYGEEEREIDAHDRSCANERAYETIQDQDTSYQEKEAALDYLVENDGIS